MDRPLARLPGLRQRRMGGPAVPIQEQGDCWATAVATLAGLDERDRNELHRRIVLSDLALARSSSDPPEGGAWWNVTQRFLAQHGLPVLGWVYEKHWGDLHPESAYIATGPSLRGDFNHSVVNYGSGDLFWDPHPSDDGLPSVIEWLGWWEPVNGTSGRVFGSSV